MNLLNIVMTLPETAIRSILIEILACLEQFYELTDMHFGGLSPSQIMFTSEGKIKLCMGLFYHFPHCNFQSIYHLKTLHKNK